MRNFEARVKYLSGDNIPGKMVDCNCSRCESSIKRGSVEDLWNPKKADLKVLGYVYESDGVVNLKWAHLCYDCSKEFRVLFDKFKQRGKAKGSPAKSPNKRKVASR
jgi:hypothetical protein